MPDEAPCASGSTNLLARSMATRPRSRSSFHTASCVCSTVLVFGVLLAAGWVEDASAQRASLRGFVTDETTGEPLQGVNLILENASGALRGVATDVDGFYLFARVEPGQYQLRTSLLGFAAYRHTLVLEAGDRRLLNIRLTETALELGEIAVEAERETGAARVTAGQESVRPEDLEMIPAPDVSGDLIGYLSTMPGVVLMGDRGGQVFVRGGEPSHNRTLLDGMDVYQPFHVLGFYSAFPAEIINRADIYAGGFGSRYTGRISSVVDVQSRNGNKRSFSGSASLSPFTAAARLEGPLIPDHLSFLGAGRLSTLDQIASQYVDAPLPYRFNDAFGKLHLQFLHYQISVSALQTYDRGTLSRDDDPFQLNDEIRWRNRAIGGRYLVAPGVLSMLGEVVISYSELYSELGADEEPARASRYESVNAAVNFTHFTRSVKTDWGFHFQAPTLEVELDGYFQNFVGGLYRSLHAGAYAEPEFHLGRGLYLRPGLSLQAYGEEGGMLEPRLRFRWERGIHHWSGAAGLYRQEIIGIADRRDATSIFTAWVGAPSGGTANALHLLLGYRVTPTPWLEVSVEGFLKRMEHLPINEWTPFPGFTTRIQQAMGATTGFDVRLEIRRRAYYLLLNYGLSSTRYDVEPEIPELPDPAAFRPPHDRRHQVNALGNVSFYGVDLSIRWQFGSGLPYSEIRGFDGFILMNGAVDVARSRGLRRVIYDEVPYGAELPTYHRLDLIVERVFAIGRRALLTLHAGAMNVYDRRNLFALDLFTAERSDQLPFVPVAGLKVEL